MSDLDTALARLTRAVDALESTLSGAMRARPSGDAPTGANALEGDAAAEIATEIADELAAERDRLAAENAELRRARDRDAELRHEATAAVKAALEDLRALMPGEAKHG